MSAYQEYGFPSFADSTGTICSDPLPLLGPRPQFSLRKLALYFSAPALEFELLPASPWENIHLVRRIPSWPPSPSKPEEIAERFADAVEAAVGDARIAAVAYSGGLDSLAVLCEVDRLCRRTGRKLVTTVINMLDDDGVSASTVALRTIDALGIQAEVRIIEDLPIRPDDSWNCANPSMIGTPHLTQAAAQAAAAAGAEVILTGLGGDEIFQTREYLLSRLIAERRFRDAWSYFGDVFRFDPFLGVPVEILAWMSRKLPRTMSFQLYVALQWTDFAVLSRDPLLMPEYREYVEDWTRQWIDSRFMRFCEDDADWMRASVLDEVYYFDRSPSQLILPERSPFLEVNFFSYALGILPTLRFQSEHLAPYHRWKSLVLRLLPKHARQVLPKHKQLFRKALQKNLKEDLDHLPPYASELGILGNTSSSDPRVRRMVRSVNRWLSGALAYGATAVD